MIGYSVVLKIHNNQVSTLFSSRSFFPDPENNEYGQFTTLKFFDNVCYLWSAAGLIQYHFPDNRFTLTAVNRICSDDFGIVSLVGNAPNDILLVSSLGNIVHYNGVDWYTDNTVYDQFGAGNFYSFRGADMKGNLVAIPGLCCGTEKAVVVVGRRDY